MPEVGSQVYWHNIPGSPAPWKDEKERARMWDLSRRVEGNISDTRYLLERPLTELLMLRRVERGKPAQADHYWGLVLEPHLSPLHGINMVMKELQVATVTREEAAEAVAAVIEEYDVMTQQQPSQSQTNAGRYSVKAEMMTQQSTAPAMDMREAPLLEVVKVLCNARGLEVSMLTKAELRRKGRIGVADVLPRRRVIMAFDRSKPHYIFVRTVMLRKAGKKGFVKPHMQLVAPTSSPVPWRRLLLAGMPNLPSNECVVVAVQRVHDNYDINGMPLKGQAAHVDDRELVLGDNNDESDDGAEGGVNRKQLKDGNPKKCRKRSRESEGDTSDGDKSDTSDEMESLRRKETAELKRWLGASPIFTLQDKLHDDPLFETPVAVLRKVPRVSHGLHDWVQRLICISLRKQLYAMRY
ncbi:hypothetical protein DQ04_11451010 [Trypanosoma grayi]|uniref:hypothetical protein n=1 Tax=Trypanosoma grayi TaxID=71804 RepID=UPI0004F4854A|nr:hypothetical protein DQ04_11451010 [Trypanosoma grayi]KEG06966.1 hypothetical protein DQ04_11451010 [Trypanosoma grayi]